MTPPGTAKRVEAAVVPASGDRNLLGQIHNADIAAALDSIADLLEIGGANRFRVRAYRNASGLVASLGEDVATMIERGADLDELPGIGEDLAGKIADIARRGTTALLERLKKEAPPGLAGLLQVPGLGPRRVDRLHRVLGIENREQLARALRDGRVAELAGFGQRLAQRLLHALGTAPAGHPRMKIAVAMQYAEPLAAWLRTLPDVDRVDIAGSYRRGLETVGDLDLVVSTADAPAVISAFAEWREVREVISQGASMASVILRSGLKVDLRAVPEQCHGAALLYFTGSRAHTIALRKIAQDRQLKLNEYGLFRGGQRVAGKAEEDVYRALGLAWIAPELREDRGEIAAARAGKLPHLLESGVIRGDLHVHTRASDGRDDLEGMAAAAEALGYDYLAVTEHSPRLTVAHGLDARRLMKQGGAIDALNQRGRSVTLLKGIEVDILADGSLDLPDAALRPLDLVVAAVHSQFGLSRAAQTERILRALGNPLVTILSHPTGRLIGAREPYDVDMEQVLRKAAGCGAMVELNAHPDRLDLTDIHCRMARDLGAMVCIGTDAHARSDLEFMRFGVSQARRGWLEARHVANTRSLADLRALFKARRSA